MWFYNHTFPISSEIVLMGIHYKSATSTTKHIYDYSFSSIHIHPHIQRKNNNSTIFIFPIQNKNLPNRLKVSITPKSCIPLSPTYICSILHVGGGQTIGQNRTHHNWKHLLMGQRWCYSCLQQQSRGQRSEVMMERIGCSDSKGGSSVRSRCLTIRSS